MYDIAIIGAGPAGMSAAITACEMGLRVVVLDSQPSPGGQIYRNQDGRKVPLISHFLSSAAVYLPSSYVWQVTTDGMVTFSIAGSSKQLQAKTVLIATGAMERPVPTPGWTLPGVMTVGAAQIMLKQSNMLPKGKVWIVGSGPLALLYANQALDEGLELAGILDTTPKQPLSHWLKLIPLIFNNFHTLLRGAKLQYRLLKLKHYTHYVSDYKIIGEKSVTGIRFCVKEKWKEVEADTILVHQGIIPNIAISRMLNLEHCWDENAFYFKPQVNDNGQSTEMRIFVAGDGSEINGAEAAELSGMLAAKQIGRYLNSKLTSDMNSSLMKISKRLKNLKNLHIFLKKMYRPLQVVMYPKGDTLVCRCEGVTVRNIENAILAGANGPRMVKTMTRCGMGMCQGRMCSLTLTNLLADNSGLSPQEIGGLSIRSPLRPINVTEFGSVEFKKNHEQE